SVSVKGTVDPVDSGDTIKIYVDGALIPCCTGTVAQYASSISIGTLSAGTHSITATATDSIGNVSLASGALDLTVPGAVSAASLGKAGSGDTATNILTQTANVAAGNTIFVTIAMDPTASTVTVSDNATGGINTYTKDADVTNGSCTAGSCTLT